MKQSVAGIVRSKEKFLIGRRLPTGAMGNRWEFPGGKVDAGETPEEALVREFREEMDIAVSVGEFIASAQFTNSGGPVELRAYAVSIPENPHIVLTEHSEIGWATLDEIERLEFVDSDRLLISSIKKWCGYDEKN